MNNSSSLGAACVDHSVSDPVFGQFRLAVMESGTASEKADWAAFICKAVNGHAELVAVITALIEADRVISENIGSKSDQAMQRIAALDAAESALKNHA